MSTPFQGLRSLKPTKCPPLLWLDLETTGLEPTTNTILEVAVSFATLNSPFDVLRSESWVVHFPTELHADLSSFIRDMHGKNGLLAECARSTTTLSDIEEQLLALVPEETDREMVPLLAGSSIHFDHAFLKVHMRRLSSRLSHRHYDVSAVKLFCQSLGMEKLPKAEAHRAAADIVESMEHARRCATWAMA